MSKNAREKPACSWRKAGLGETDERRGGLVRLSYLYAVAEMKPRACRRFALTGAHMLFEAETERARRGFAGSAWREERPGILEVWRRLAGAMCTTVAQPVNNV